MILKNKNTRRMVCAALYLTWLGTCCSWLGGQSVTAPERLRTQKELDEALSSIALGMPGQNETVKGRPFSAEAITETSTLSASGQRENHKNVTRIDRDREGRTRREQTIEAITPAVSIAPHKIIFIFDPVKAKNFVIDPEEHITRVFPGTQQGARRTGDGSQQIDSRTPISVTEKPLGQKRIGDLLCTGIRRTASTVLNGNPSQGGAQTITESWSSVELGVVVDSWTRNPKSGSAHYFLSRISRDDPSPELFTPPLNFKVEEIRTAK